MSSSEANRQPWYQGFTRYQWLVFIIASLGWVFEVFEGEVYVATMNESMQSPMPGAAWLIYALPIFGFLTRGMHAGFAVYFPELFPTWLRGTGMGACFNLGRVLAAPVLVLTG